MLFLTKKDIQDVFSMAEAIEADKQALRMYTEGKSTVPLRTNIEAINGQNLFMPAYVSEINTSGIKIVSVFPDNPKIGKPAVPAQMLLLDGETGEVSALLDGTYLTQLRTGAVQGAATDLLARKDASFAVLIGAGGQAESQLEAMITVRDLKHVAVIDLNTTLAQEFVDRMNEKFPEVEIFVSKDNNKDIAQADIITAVTTAPVAVFDGNLIKPGCHINGIGSYTKDMKELPLEAISKADILMVDTYSGVFAEAGDIMEALKQGLVTEEDFIEMGEAILDPSLKRSNDEQITLFNSVGTAVLDVVVAKAIYDKAKSMSKGQEIII